MVFHSRLADKTFFCCYNTIYSERNFPDRRNEVVIEMLIHNFTQCGTKNHITVVKNKTGSEKRSPVIGCFITFAHDQCNGNADESRNGSNRIAPMVPGVCLER